MLFELVKTYQIFYFSRQYTTTYTHKHLDTDIVTANT